MIVTAANARTTSLEPVRPRGALPAGAAKIESISARTPRHHSCAHGMRRHRGPEVSGTGQQQDTGRGATVLRRTSGAHGCCAGLAALPLTSCVTLWKITINSGKPQGERKSVVKGKRGSVRV